MIQMMNMMSLAARRKNIGTAQKINNHINQPYLWKKMQRKRMMMTMMGTSPNTSLTLMRMRKMVTHQNISWTVRRMTKKTKRKAQGHQKGKDILQGLDLHGQAPAQVLPVLAQVQGLGQALGTVDLDHAVIRGHAQTAGAKCHDQIVETKGLDPTSTINALGPGLKTGMQGRTEADIQVHQDHTLALPDQTRMPNG